MGRVIVLGANGRLGLAAVQAFAAAGWSVTAQMRRAPRLPLPSGVRLLTCNALDPAALTRAAAGADLIVHALNPDYTRWETELPPLTAAVIALARATGATLMIPGNVYNFGNRLPERLDEATPFSATHAKARQRIALEAALAAAAADGVRSIVVRAGDFLGDDGTWIDLAMAKDLGRGRFTQMGPADVVHAWAWLPDLARCFVAVAERRAKLPPHAVLHYAGLSVTGAQLQSAFEQALGRTLRTVQFPWWVMALASPFWPMARALREMRYLWQRTHRLDDGRLRALIGEPPATPLADVVRRCIAALDASRAPAVPAADQNRSSARSVTVV